MYSIPSSSILERTFFTNSARPLASTNISSSVENLLAFFFGRGLTVVATRILGSNLQFDLFLPGWRNYETHFGRATCSLSSRERGYARPGEAWLQQNATSETAQE